jgi:PKD repeat protein
MKKILLLMALACPPGFAIAQTCTPDLSITQPGMYPGTDINLPAAYVGVPYSTSVQFRVMTDTTISGTYVTVTNIVLDSVAGLPSGFSWTSNPANHIFPGGTNACASLSGNPVSGLVGTHSLVVHVTVHGLAFGFIPVTQATTVTGYKIKIYGPPLAYFAALPTVICEGDATVFDDNSSGHPTSWLWSFPGGTPSSSTLQFPPPVVYASSGNKSITLTVSSPAGSDAITKNSYITVNTGPASPSITPTGNVTVCYGSSVAFSAGTGSGLTYQWKKNGVNITGATSSTYSAATSGGYSVQVMLASGCSKTSAETNVTVSNVLATITALGPTSFCPGGSVSLKANSGSGLTYQWKKDGLLISGATNISYIASAAGTYKVIVTNSSGCSKGSAGLAVAVNNLPSATITAGGPLSFCQGQSVSLTANSGTGLTYQWKKDGFIISGATGISFNAVNTGAYRVIVTNSGGCSKLSQPKSVTVNSLPSASVTANGPLSFCQGKNVTLTTNSGTGLTYQWKKAGVIISGATGISYTAVNSGTYTVRVTNSGGCSKLSQTQTVTVNSLPSASVTANGPLAFCQGQSVTLTANSGTGLTYQWKKYGVNISGASSASLITNETGVYKVRVTNTSGCSKASAEKTVTVNGLPSAVITANGPLTFCQGQNVTLTANSGAGLDYQWTKDNTNISGATNQSFIAANSGEYRTVVTNSNGCTKTSNKKNVVVNCREENDQNNLSAGDETAAVLYPNPATSAATIDLNLAKAGTVSIKLIDITGKIIAVIAEGNFEEGMHQFTFDVSSLAKGIYFTRISASDKLSTIKLMVDNN